MLRFIYVIVMRTFSIMYFVPKMAHYARNPQKYSELDKYLLAQTVMDKVRKTARVTTVYYGVENLPKENGYIMYSNHQGKYDALGILLGHEKTCSVLMDKKRSKMFIAKQFIDMLGGQRLERNSPKQQVKVLMELSREVSEGRNYLIFPEGGYGKKTDNSLDEFKSGCFSCALRAKCPVVPVAILDSYKPFGINSLKKLETTVIFLPPIMPEEYEGMRAYKLCEMVKERIENEINAREAERKAG